MTTAIMTMMSIVTCIERFSNDCRKNNTKVNTATNHDKRKQRDKPIRIPTNYCSMHRKYHA